MKKIQTIQVVKSDDATYNTLSGFIPVAAPSASGAIGINITDSGKRIRLNASLATALGDPEAVQVLLNENAAMAAIVAVQAGTPESYNVGKSGTLYATELADKIMEIATGVTFEGKGTTQCGKIEQVQADENGTLTAILSFPK